VQSTPSDRLFSLVRTSVLSRLAGSIGWSVRWANWDTASARFAWALGPSEAPRSESGGGLWDTASTTREGRWPTCLQGDAEKGPESRATKDARGAGGVNQLEAIRQASWISPNARDWKDSGPTQGKRKSPNLGTQVIRAEAGLLETSR